MNKLPVSFRKMEVGDIPFIINSWSRAFWKRFQYVPSYHKLIHNRIYLILENASVILAVDPEDPLVIYGYAVWGPDTLHWVYVKHPLRRLGLSKQLLLQIPYNAKFMHSHETPIGMTAIANKINSRFNPFILEGYTIHET